MLAIEYHVGLFEISTYITLIKNVLSKLPPWRVKSVVSRAPSGPGATGGLSSLSVSAAE